MAILVPDNKCANNNNAPTAAIVLALTNKNSKPINYLERVTLQNQRRHKDIRRTLPTLYLCANVSVLLFKEGLALVGEYNQPAG